ncbi:glutamine--tRNA ligase/YqeY domain fusion protein [Solidesulfovibrio sp.]|jgi:glutaminyl-tRNA synthetase|uniref:glutamine--tRNA ligase/YqeY domain fusion protein n=1 Tax=Solidesulfovibrio sp. TaxID=2910990 RepID=UPI000EE6965B|nr:glutamine--tRNA ligase/YqeY domain fusion protein [Solidesulfovibrio sp.]MEA5088031.1 glutamine--tRNA ligase/YqeY domain fusion protein [Solidesulfovibrio sp.]HCR12681.1 glutamine--tRNA ligase [Desulfovibrio sp.]HML60921.1 glutamine--tRNA ligase/YqeY domain fusion protein [Solidesulfovibrio sp.]
MTAPDADEKDKSGPAAGRDFIRQIIDEDMKTGKWNGRVHTRFPPEPNGYLHIGHAKSICLNFGLAREFGGQCNLRFDDTNPAKEEVEYVDSIQEDVRWLGFTWDDRMFYASNYFDRLYAFAETLIEKGLAYVDDLSQEEIRAYRGTLTEPGKDSPYRGRSVAENLDLFRRMRAGEFPDGAKVLRAKIDMQSPNVVLRDPVLYRIKHVEHHRTGDAWCVYPMYDYTHCISDSLEGITHSICSLEFENNRPLYDWVLDNLPVPCHPQQIEFARLNLSYTVLSKRKLIQLVTQKVVSGWDDPRLPTLSGIRRRGYTPEAIRDFCERIGISKAENMVDMALLEHCLREDLNRSAKRVMAVLRPLKVVIENYPEGQVEEIDFPYHPEDASLGSRKVPFTREIYVERDDFMETPAKKWFRLAPGAEVRLRYAYYVTCTDVVKDPATGEVTELRCVHDPATKGGWSSDGRKVKGTLHWVSAAHAVPAEVRLYDRLFTKENPAEGKGDFMEALNPASLEVIPEALVEPSLAALPVGERVQFERLGYFCVDKDSTPQKRVFNRAVALKDSWVKAGGR